MSERCGGESTEIMGYNTIVNFNVLRYSECHGTETKRQRCELAECANHFSIQTSKSYLGHMKNTHLQIWKTKNVLLFPHECTQTSLGTLVVSFYPVWDLSGGICWVLKQGPLTFLFPQRKASTIISQGLTPGSIHILF